MGRARSSLARWCTRSSKGGSAQSSRELEPTQRRSSPNLPVVVVVGIGELLPEDPLPSGILDAPTANATRTAASLWGRSGVEREHSLGWTRRNPTIPPNQRINQTAVS